MRYAYIAPTNWLEFVPEQSTYHLLLAHLLTDAKYVEFYKQKQLRGDTIIIDNGCFEFKRPLEPAEYFKLVSESGLNPTVVVAPDYYNEPWEKTVEAAHKFSSEYKKYFDQSTTLMCVPQSNENDWEGWLKCYHALGEVQNCSMIGMSIIGIPNAFKAFTGTSDVSFNRTFCTEMLINTNNVLPKWHHYLGNDSPRELLMMRVQGVADGTDSSSPIWHGINSIMFDDTASGLKNGKLKTPVDFDLPNSLILNTLEHNCIAHNLWWIDNILTKKI